MAGGVNLDDDDGITEINITPLVDVMLVLLIIFIVASIYIVKESIEVELPKAASAGESLDQTLSIVVDKGGRLYLNGDPTNEERIARACQTAVQRDPNTQAMISADTSVRHGEVIKVIDLIRVNGLTKFAINVKLPSEQQQ
jgi:biopolymer transport protein ExbD